MSGTSNALEIGMLISGIALIVLSSITIDSVHKMKAKCMSADKKDYDTVVGIQVAQLVIAVIVTILAGSILWSQYSKSKGGAGLTSADRVRAALRGL